jgi:hypothetical protein
MKEMKMKNLKDKENNSWFPQTSIGMALDKYEKDVKNSEDTKALTILKDNFRSNTTGTDDDLVNNVR